MNYELCYELCHILKIEHCFFSSVYLLVTMYLQQKYRFFFIFAKNSAVTVMLRDL